MEVNNLICHVLMSSIKGLYTSMKKECKKINFKQHIGIDDTHSTPSSSIVFTADRLICGIYFFTSECV